MFQADLHCHSTASDGTLSPAEVIREAKDKGLSAVALTDHDTTLGIYEAYEQANRSQIAFISGIEISSHYAGKSVHVLGYGFDPEQRSFQSFVHQQQLFRHERNEAILKLLSQHGLTIPKENLSHYISLGRAHIAKEMLHLGYVQTFQEAFYKWIGDKACCYVPGKKPSISDCIHSVHQAGGKIFLAHPHLIPAPFASMLIRSFAWDGIEAYYGRFTKNIQKVWVDLALRKKLLISGGSDFHGSIKPECILGSSYIDHTAYQALVKDTFWQALT